MARSHLIDTRVALLIQSVRFANIDKVATHSRPLDTGVWDNRRERRSPLLGKGGVAAASSKWSRSFGGAAGVVRSTSDNRWLRLRPLRRLRGIFLMGAATPPCPRRGLRLSLQLFSMPPCPAKDVGHGKLIEGCRSRFLRTAGWS